MAGGGTQGQQQGTVFGKNDQQNINTAIDQYKGTSGEALQQGQQALGLGSQAPAQLQTSFSSFFNPAQFNTNFSSGPAGLDARGQALVSQQQAGAQRAAAAQNAAFRQTNAGRNSGLADVLGQQGQQLAALSSQPAYFQAAQDQAARMQAQNQALMQSAQQQAALQQAGNQAGLQQQEAQNAAAALMANLAAAYQGLGQNQLSTLLTAGQARGQQYAAGLPDNVQPKTDPNTGFSSLFQSNNVYAPGYLNALAQPTFVRTGQTLTPY